MSGIIVNPKNYTGRELETIFFRPLLSGPSVESLGIRVLYNMPVPTVVQLWDRTGNVLQSFDEASSWGGGTKSTHYQKTIPLQRVKAENAFGAADYFSTVFELITNRSDVNMEDLTGTELEAAETELFRNAIADSIRMNLWLGDKGNEYGTGTWFNWVKTYSALAGCLGFIALRFVKWRGKDGKTHYLYEKRWALCFPPLILAINIAEAVIRDFQVFSFGLWQGGVVENLWTISGPWNIMNGIAGILNILTICGWFGIFISKDPSKDMIWPDMIWAWIIAYDLWNFAYTYNCISDHSAYCGLALLLACTIPTFFIKRGAWLQHRAQTLALWIMFVMTVPQFADVLAPIPTTHNPTAFFVVSLIALASNVALAAYQLYRIRKLKLNPLKDQIYADTKTYQRIVEENE